MTDTAPGFPDRLVCTRTLAAIAVANYLAMAALNGTSAGTGWTLPVYALSLALAVLLVRAVPARRNSSPLSAGSLWLGALLLMMLTLPRLLYLAEWFPGGTVMAQFDDYARLAQLASLTLSEHYPLRHPSSSEFLLSFYYCSLYPMVALKQLLPFLTLKDCLVAGNLLYHLLIIGSLLEFAQRHLPAPRRFAWVFLVTVFAGFDWLALTGNAWHGHDEWWQFPLFNGFFQISAPYTTLFWTVHHYLGAWLLVVAWMLATQGGPSRAKLPLLALLGLSAAFSSPFAALPGLLFLLPMAPLLLRRLARSPATWLILLSALAPALVFTDRLESAGFAWQGPRLQWLEQPLADLLLSAPAYLLATALVDLAGLPLLAALLWSRFNRRDRAWFLAATAFYLSTAFISFSGFNNYTMRGMQLPALFYAYAVVRYLPLPAAPQLPRLALPVLALAALLASWGGLRESAANMRTMALGSHWYYEARGEDVPRYILPRYRELCRTRGEALYREAESGFHGIRKFNACRLTETDADELDRWEREIARRRPANR